MKKHLLLSVAFALLATIGAQASVKDSIDLSGDDYVSLYGNPIGTISTGSSDIIFEKGGAYEDIEYDYYEGIEISWKNDITIKKTDDTKGNIIGISLIFEDDMTGMNFSATNGGLYIDGYNLNWTGNTDEVKIHRLSVDYNDLQQVIVYYADGSSVLAPTFVNSKPAFGTSQKITLRSDEGSDIYYTTDGTDPTSGSTKYAQPFDITSSCLVKAIAVKNGASSLVAGQNFVQQKVINNIADFIKCDQNANVILELTNAQVLATADQRLFIKDATGCTELAGYDFSYKQGDVLNGTVYTQFNLASDYSYGYINDFSAYNSLSSTTGDKPVAETVTKADASLYNHYIKFENVTVKQELDVANAKMAYYFTVDSKKIYLDGTILGDDKVYEDGKTYSPSGILYYYDGTNMKLLTFKDNQATGIQNIRQHADSESSVIYTIDGKKVFKNSLKKGEVYIQNGKKYIQK